MTPPERGHWRAGVDSGLGLLGPEVSLRHPRGDARTWGGCQCSGERSRLEQQVKLEVQSMNRKAGGGVALKQPQGVVMKGVS